MNTPRINQYSKKITIIIIFIAWTNFRTKVVRVQVCLQAYLKVFVSYLNMNIYRWRVFNIAHNTVERFKLYVQVDKPVSEIV